MWISDAGMMECVNGHTFCEDHADPWEPPWEEKRDSLLKTYRVRNDKAIKTYLESASTEEMFEAACAEYDLEYVFDASGVPAGACPICSFGKIYERDALLFMLKTAGRTEGSLLSEMKQKFGSYQEMKRWLTE